MTTTDRTEAPELRALFLNCTLKRSPAESNTDGLIELSRRIMEKANVRVEALRPVDYDIATGVKPDMTDDGWERDDWPAIHEKVLASDILVLTTPIWLGQMSSETTKVIERLYAHLGDTNDQGQGVFYGRVGGSLVTGNEDGAKQCSMHILYSLQHLGFAIPPQSESYWVGEAGPGASYRDEESSGPESDFTNKTLTFMTWNLIHLARALKQAGGFPAGGNQMSAWQEGERFGHPGPDAVRSLRGGPSQKKGPVREPARA